MCFRQSSAGLLAEVSPIEYVRRPRIKLNVDTERRLRYNGNMNITKKRKQKLLVAALALTVMLTPGGIFAAQSGAGTANRAKTTDGTSSAVSTYESAAEKPEVSAEGAMVLCSGTNQILYEKNINERLDPLSTTKLMTVYLTMKAVDDGKITLDTVFTASRADTKVMESKLYLKKGEKMKVRYLIYATLLHSANDAAATLGSNLAGSKTKFASLMNKTAKALGCTGTRFTNANGLIEKGCHSTPRDMLLIARACFSYSFVQKVCQTKTCKIPPTNLYDDKITVTTTNPFYEKHKKARRPYEKYNIIAGKTGTWDADNASLIEMAEYKGRYIYTIVMNDKLNKRYPDTVKLIEYARNVIDEQEAHEQAEKQQTTSAKVTGAKGAVYSALGKTALFRQALSRINRISAANTARISTAGYTSEDGVRLEWDGVSGAKGYDIYRSDGGTFKKIASTGADDEETYTDAGVKKNRIYRYYIQAKRGNMLEFFLAK